VADKDPDEGRFEAMLGGPSGKASANPQVKQQPKVRLTPEEHERVERVYDGPLPTEEEHVEQRFSFSVNLGTGTLDLLDTRMPGNYFPMKVSLLESETLARTLNQHPALAVGYPWHTNRPAEDDQVIQGLEEITNRIIELDRGVRQGRITPPREALVRLKKMLTDRGI